MSSRSVLGQFGLEGRCALVTGGSIGIGRSIALACAEAGADVAIQHAPTADAAVGRGDAAVEMGAAIERLGRRSLVIAADFAERGEARRCVREVEDRWGGSDILVICASVQHRSDFLAIDPHDVAREVAINFAATIELLQSALPAMERGGWGRVLSIGSVNQERPDPELATYAALKAAQHNLIVNLARQYAPRSVTLNTISPGLIATDRNAWRRGDAAEWDAIQARANPMGRAGSPDDVAGAALLLCSPAGAFITGADVPVSGGGQL